MHIAVVCFIAFRYIFGKTINQFSRYIYWVSSIFIMLSIAVMIIILSVMNGFESELKKNLLYLTPHILITSSSGYTHVNNIPNFLFHEMSDNIAYFKPLVISNIILQGLKEISLGMLLGIDPNHFEPLSKYLKQNNNITKLVSGEYNIIIGSELAQKLSVKINDQIRIIVPSVNQITPIGCLFSQRLFTISDIYFSNNGGFDTNQVLMHKDDAAVLLHYPDRCVTGWRIWVHEPFKLNKFDYLDIPKDWIWKDWREYKGSLFQAIKMEKSIMFLLFILIIIISGCNIVAFLVLSIVEKQKEIAILKTCGFNRSQVLILFIMQGMSNSIIGIVLGIGLGLLFSIKLNQILLFFNISSEKIYFPVEIQYIQIFSIIIIICVLNLLIILFPAWRMSSIRAIQILRHG
ncbi:lipoprotein-releasing system transmembrane protein lolC [Candidatus Blochmanniella vafra str. BVAF]|uniref:Lipoprotein-releasing system transmembrane protein lolC n=1 Tax=Blochmanniella vafra (strain BVAF) TaxID=859654 RepID=E8Q698_BLOVB|nr:FtsX-like permease family protein [Candidatus Blochmannia vafer]ADV33792.1 lipoprotein-releasing system transmembrane protein lolC [Candidatus Blochmannia vafer str. BVAF]